ncbi:MAG TPA: DUF503 domain-containing protein [Tepidiformaceae bacterium]|nr:DUF503 domain-containing protein [Tepidiformaceae bacterium]
MAATVGVLHIRLALPSATLKEKRTIVKSLVARLRTRFNASVAEVADLDDPGHATLAATCVSNDARHADSQLQAVANAIQEWRLDAEVIGLETELFPV